jgi:hypothetical protein
MGTPDAQEVRRREDLFKVISFFAALAGLPLLFVLVNAPPSIGCSAAALWALACFISGAAVGFIFGIPKRLQTDFHTEGKQSRKSPARGRSGDFESENTAAYRLLANTSLNEISDWLTNIIVGVGLVELRSIPGCVKSVAAILAGGTADTAAFSFAVALILYFSILGFLFGYLATRLFLSIAFGRVDIEGMHIEERRIGELRSGALRRQVESALEEGEAKFDVEDADDEIAETPGSDTEAVDEAAKPESNEGTELQQTLAELDKNGG